MQEPEDFLEAHVSDNEAVHLKRRVDQRVSHGKR